MDLLLREEGVVNHWVAVQPESAIVRFADVSIDACHGLYGCLVFAHC